jgi:hypothetical protein
MEQIPGVQAASPAGFLIHTIAELSDLSEAEREWFHAMLRRRAPEHAQRGEHPWLLTVLSDWVTAGRGADHVADMEQDGDPHA